MKNFEIPAHNVTIGDIVDFSSDDLNKLIEFNIKLRSKFEQSMKNLVDLRDKLIIEENETND